MIITGLVLMILILLVSIAILIRDFNRIACLAREEYNDAFLKNMSLTDTNNALQESCRRHMAENGRLKAKINTALDTLGDV